MRKYIVISLLIVCLAAAAYLALRPSPTPPVIGYGGIRQPTVLLPPNMTMTRTYDAETDLVCLTFVNKVSGPPYYLQSTDCEPRRNTDY